MIHDIKILLFIEQNWRGISAALLAALILFISHLRYKAAQARLTTVNDQHMKVKLIRQETQAKPFQSLNFAVEIKDEAKEAMIAQFHQETLQVYKDEEIEFTHPQITVKKYI